MQHILAATRLAVALSLLALFGVPASAQQQVPSPAVQEIVIKTALMTLNDANTTGNYAVMYAKLAKPVRDRITAAKLAEAFKGFRDRHIFFDLVVAKAPIASELPTVDNEGQLRLKGYFEANPNHLVYDLGFLMEDGAWRVATINAYVKNPN
jgi:hypothetical protein